MTRLQNTLIANTDLNALALTMPQGWSHIGNWDGILFKKAKWDVEEPYTLYSMESTRGGMGGESEMKSSITY